jgi:hypothetical protein
MLAERVSHYQRFEILDLFLYSWTFKMANLYQDKTVTKDLIKNRKLKWCKIMFAIYIKLPSGQYTRVSPPTFSDLIKNSK